MPTAPPRWCAPCQQAHSAGCPAKQRPVDTRANATDRGYGSRWQKIRALKRARDPLCEMCRAKGFVRLADMVDHILPLAAGGSHGDENLQSLCWSDHALKTAEDKAKYPQVYDNRTHRRW